MCGWPDKEARQEQSPTNISVGDFVITGKFCFELSVNATYRLLLELPNEELWDRRLSETQDTLGKLAIETRTERAAGNATELEPDKL